LIALAGGLWLARLIEILLAPIFGVMALLVVLLGVWIQEKRLINFALFSVAVALAISAIQIWSVEQSSESKAIQNQLSLEGQFTVQSDSAPFGSGFRTWIEFSANDFSPTIGSLIDDQGSYKWGETYSATLSLEPSWMNGRGHFIANASSAPVLIDNPGFIESTIGQIRASFLASLDGVSADSKGLVAGLAVGERTLLSEETSENMRRVALTHLVAVSGANCAIVLASVYFGLGLLRAPRRMRFIAALASLVIYVLVVGFEPSVLRAGFMAATVILAMWLGRGVAPLRALALSMLVLLTFDPWLATDFAFALSVFSTLGILVLAPAIYERLSMVPKPLAVGLAVSFSAQLYCIPVMLMLQPELPLLGVLANILAEPMVAPVTVLGITAVFLSPFLPAVSSLLSFIASLGTWWIALVANRLGSLPQATLPWPNDILGLSLAVLMALTITLSVLSRRHRMLGLSTTSILILGSAFGYAENQLRIQQFASQAPEIVNCDVGQGDALLIRSQGQTMLIDVGRDDALIAKCLRDNEISRIDLLVLSHYDYDHVGGIEGLEDVEIAKVLVSGFNDTRDAVSMVDEFLAEGSAIVATGYRGMTGDFGSGFWEVVSPTANAAGALNANDASVVLLLLLPSVQILALGDIGESTQESILNQGLMARIDETKPLVLKVSHHGSADQSLAFHQYLAPEVSIISVGENSYGHPDPRLISQLRSLGSKVLRTDQSGMIGIQSEPELEVFATGKL
jgi:competence protein ComEC